MADPELNELLGQLESHIADEDESVERAKASLECNARQLEAHARGRGRARRRALPVA